jgi:hypothetical protein
MNIRIDNYGSDKTNNAIVVSFENITLWFSYHTLVAFKVGNRRIVSENLWGVTTGKHLNSIDGKDVKNRYKKEQFEREWEEVLSKIRVIGD